jgi:glutaredoxin 3
MSDAIFKVYTTEYCGYCTRAKQLLKQKGIAFEEIDLTQNLSLWAELKKKYNWPTVPIVLNNDQLIGGYTELVRYFQSQQA